ncbi:MAG: response regulator [Pseudoclavibacter sp.]
MPLLVEDDAETLGMIADLVDDSRVVQTGTGEPGFDLALRSRFDVMVLDRRLPGMDGMAPIRTIRHASISPPVLMPTALGSVADRSPVSMAGSPSPMVHTARPTPAATTRTGTCATRRSSRRSTSKTTARSAPPTPDPSTRSATPNSKPTPSPGPSTRGRLDARNRTPDGCRSHGHTRGAGRGRTHRGLIQRRLVAPFRDVDRAKSLNGHHRFRGVSAQGPRQTDTVCDEPPLSPVRHRGRRPPNGAREQGWIWLSCGYRQSRSTSISLNPVGGVFGLRTPLSMARVFGTSV